MDNRGKIIKVTFEYENSKESLSGKQVEKWKDILDGMCVMASVRGQNQFENTNFKWKNETRIEKLKKLNKKGK